MKDKKVIILSIFMLLCVKIFSKFVTVFWNYSNAILFQSQKDNSINKYFFALMHMK